MRGAIVVGLVIVGCSKTSAPAPTKMGPLACEQVFVAPENATLVCDEHVTSTDGTEIHWQSYSLPEPRTSYCYRYLDAARTCGYGFVFKPPACDVVYKDKRAELFFRESTEGGAGYPTCAKKPDPTHQTIVVISDKTVRPH